MGKNKWEEAPIVGAEQTTEKKHAWEDAPVVEDKSAKPKDYVDSFIGGFNTGLAGIAGMPVDITNAVLNSVGIGSEEPVGGSNWFQKKLQGASDLVGGGAMFPKGADTTGGRILRRVGEEVGATSIPGGAMLKVAGSAKKAKVGYDVGKRGFAREQILDPISRSPGKAAIGEGIAATGSGIGAGTAQEIKPGDTTLETYGQLIGGVAPGVTPTAWVNRGKEIVTGWVSSRFSSSSQKALAERAISKVMQGALSGNAGKNLKESQRLRKQAPGFDPTTAEATGDPSLIRQQQALEKEAQGKFLRGVLERRKRNEAAVAEFSGRVAPDADANTGLVVRAADGRVEVIGDRITRLVARNAHEQEILAGGIPRVDKIESGQILRKGIDDARTDASLKMSLRAEELGINDADLSVPFKDWQDKIKTKYAPNSRFVDTGEQPKILKQIVNDKGTKTNFQDIKAIREEITDELIKALSPVNRDRKKIRILTRLKKDVDGLVSSLDKELGANYTQFRKEYLDNFIKPFESGAVYKVRRSDGTGFVKTSDEMVASEFTKNQSSARQFREVFGNDENMMNALHDSVLDDLANKAIKDGVIDKNKFLAWKNKNKDMLKELPNISKSVDDLEKTQNALWDRQAQLGRRQQYVDDKLLVHQLSRYRKGTTTGDKILERALMNEKSMGGLVSFIKKDKGAFESLKRIMWNKVSQGSSEDILRQIDTYRGSLKQLFGPEHFKNLEDISIMKAMMESVEMPKGKPYKSKPMEGFEKLTGMAVPQAGTRYWAFMSGRVPKYYLAFDIAKSAMYKKAQRHFDMIMKDALYDKEIAKELAESIRTGVIHEKKARRLGARLFALGIPYVREENK